MEHQKWIREERGNREVKSLLCAKYRVLKKEVGPNVGRRIRQEHVLRRQVWTAGELQEKNRGGDQPNTD